MRPVCFSTAGKMDEGPSRSPERLTFWQTPCSRASKSKADNSPKAIAVLRILSSILVDELLNDHRSSFDFEFYIADLFQDVEHFPQADSPVHPATEDALIHRPPVNHPHIIPSL